MGLSCRPHPFVGLWIHLLFRITSLICLCLLNLCLFSLLFSSFHFFIHHSSFSSPTNMAACCMSLPNLHVILSIYYLCNYIFVYNMFPIYKRHYCTSIALNDFIKCSQTPWLPLTPPPKTPLTHLRMTSSTSLINTPLPCQTPALPWSPQWGSKPWLCPRIQSVSPGPTTLWPRTRSHRKFVTTPSNGRQATPPVESTR